MCTFSPSTANSSSNALHAVRYGRQLTERKEASPKEHVLQLLCQSQAGTLQAITLAETSHLLVGLFAWYQQLLTHTAGKCD